MAQKGGIMPSNTSYYKKSIKFLMENYGAYDLAYHTAREALAELEWETLAGDILTPGQAKQFEEAFIEAYEDLRDFSAED